MAPNQMRTDEHLIEKYRRSASTSTQMKWDWMGLNGREKGLLRIRSEFVIVTN